MYSSGPAVYEIGGTEYVALEFGGGGNVAVGGGNQTFTGNALVAFALPKAAAAAAKAKTK